MSKALVPALSHGGVFANCGLTNVRLEPLPDAEKRVWLPYGGSVDLVLENVSPKGKPAKLLVYPASNALKNPYSACILASALELGAEHKPLVDALTSDQEIADLEGVCDVELRVRNEDLNGNKAEKEMKLSSLFERTSGVKLSDLNKLPAICEADLRELSACIAGAEGNPDLFAQEYNSVCQDGAAQDENAVFIVDEINRETGVVQLRLPGRSSSVFEASLSNLEGLQLKTVLSYKAKPVCRNVFMQTYTRLKKSYLHEGQSYSTAGRSVLVNFEKDKGHLNLKVFKNGGVEGVLPIEGQESNLMREDSVLLNTNHYIGVMGRAALKIAPFTKAICDVTDGKFTNLEALNVLKDSPALLEKFPELYQRLPNEVSSKEDVAALSGVVADIQAALEKEKEKYQAKRESVLEQRTEKLEKLQSKLDKAAQKDGKAKTEALEASPAIAEPQLEADSTVDLASIENEKAASEESEVQPQADVLASSIGNILDESPSAEDTESKVVVENLAPTVADEGNRLSDTNPKEEVASLAAKETEKATEQVASPVHAM